MKAARAHKRIHRKSLRLFAIQSQQWRRRERRGGTQLAPPCLFVLVQRRRSVREQPRSQRRRSDNLDPLSRPAALAVSCSAGLLGRSVAPNRFHRRRTFETHRSRNAASLRNPQVSENDNGDTLHGSFNFFLMHLSRGHQTSHLYRRLSCERHESAARHALVFVDSSKVIDINSI